MKGRKSSAMDGVNGADEMDGLENMEQTEDTGISLLTLNFHSIFTAKCGKM
jgi:hypothetical protein